MHVRRRWSLRSLAGQLSSVLFALLLGLGEAAGAAPGVAGESQPKSAVEISEEPGEVTTLTAAAVEAGGKKKEEEKKTKKKRKKEKKKKRKKKLVVNQGTELRLGAFGASFIEGPTYAVMGTAGLHQRLQPRKNHRIHLGIDYEYEPFSTKTLGFPEEDEAMKGLESTLVVPMHLLQGNASRRIKWNKWLRTSLRLHADAWWPEYAPHRRWLLRATPGVRFGKRRGFYGEITGDIFYKKYPGYYVATRRIDQEGFKITSEGGYNFAKIARLTLGFEYRFTHYLDARYNMLNENGAILRSPDSKNYRSYTPFAAIRVQPGGGVELRARYSFQRQITENYDRAMTGRDEFFSLEQKYFEGYYDFRRHRLAVQLGWKFRDRLDVGLAAEAWVRHFDVYEARTEDNVWTGELRVGTQIKGSGELAFHLYRFEWLKQDHVLSLKLFGSHITRTSNMRRQVSLATNFVITRIFLGLELRGG